MTTLSMYRSLLSNRISRDSRHTENDKKHKAQNAQNDRFVVLAVLVALAIVACSDLVSLSSSGRTVLWHPHRNAIPHNCTGEHRKLRIFDSHEDEVDRIVSRLRAADVFGDPFVLESDIASESKRAAHGVAIILNTLGRAGTRTNMHKVIEHYDADVYAYHVYDTDDDFEQHHNIIKRYVKAWPKLRAVDLERNLPQAQYLAMAERYKISDEAFNAITDKRELCAGSVLDPEAPDGIISRSNAMSPIDSMLFAAVCMPNSTFRTAVYQQYGIWRTWQLLRAGEAARGARYEYVMFGREDSYSFKMPPPVELLRRTNADVWNQERSIIGPESAFPTFGGPGLDDRVHIQRRAVAEAFARSFEWLFHSRSAQVAAYMTRFGAERGLLAHTRIVGAENCKYIGVQAIACCGGFHCRWNEEDAHTIPGTKWMCSILVNDARFVPDTDEIDDPAADLSAYRGQKRVVGVKVGKPIADSLVQAYVKFDAEVPQNPRPNCRPSAVPFNNCTLDQSGQAQGCSVSLSNGERICKLKDFQWPRTLPCEWGNRAYPFRPPSNELLDKSLKVAQVFLGRGHNVTIDTARFMADNEGKRLPQSHQWPWIIEEFRASVKRLRLVESHQYKAK